MEAQLCGGEEVIVVGGGNSAGQAAVFLAQTARRVHMLVRSDGLAESMSRYLIRRIEDNPAIDAAHAHRDRRARRRRPSRARAAGATSATGATETPRHPPRLRDDRRRAQHGLARGCVALDAKGFIKTGPDLSHGRAGAPRAGRSPARPYLLETSLPGVFAVGDVRSGNIKRVASAVGEGSIAISFVHRVLQGS